LKKPLNQIIHEKFQLGPAYHMTHIQNLSGILNDGELRSHNHMRGCSYFNLANEEVQAGRAAVVVSVSGLPLHDYVPLYFGYKTPMVASNQKFNEDLLFLRFSLDILSTSNTVFSDGNARSLNTKFYLFKDVQDLSALDVAAIRTTKYAGKPEIKRKKQSELLISNLLPISHILDIICYSESARTRTLEILQKFDIKKPVKVNPGWYFTQA